MFLETKIKNFYSALQFPGPYTMADIEYGGEHVVNRYLDWYNQQIGGARSVCDVGCGSGFLTHWLAMRHPDVVFDAVDFSDAIDYAQDFGRNHDMQNVNYIKQDFLAWTPDRTYDLVICNGVLHHIPRLKDACVDLQHITGVKMAIGIYNKFGKLAKKFSNISYVNDILYQDQELCPFEQSFTHREFLDLFPDFHVQSVLPSYNNHLVNLYNLFNYRNGGLTLYALELQHTSAVDQ